MNEINPVSTKAGLSAADLLSNHIFDVVDELHLTDEQEFKILRSLGVSAPSSKGAARQRNLITSLENSLASRIVSVGESVALEPWQEALDWNTSLLIKKQPEDHEDRLVYDYSQIIDLWRSTSPFTQRDNEVPQYEFQTSRMAVLDVIYQHVQHFMAQRNIHEVTLHKALRWENHNTDIPLSEDRPSWYQNPVPDRSEDGFDEEFSARKISAKSVLLSNLTGFTCDHETAVQMARWSMHGERSQYYAVLSGTFPVESIISIPTMGIGAISKMECVVDSRFIQSGAFSVMFGRRS